MSSLQTNFLKVLDLNAGDVMQPAQEAAKFRFLSGAIPTRKDEAWRYLNLKPLFETNYRRSERAAFYTDETFHYRLVFANGNFETSHSKLPPGLTIMPLNEAIEMGSLHEDVLTSKNPNLFTDLNVASLSNGYFIEVNESIKEPIVLRHNYSDDGNYGSNFVVINVKSNVSASFLDESSSVDNLITHQFRFVIARDANLDWTQVHQTQIANKYQNIEGKVHDNATINYTQVNLGGGLIRQDMSFDILGSNANVNLQGLYLLHGTQTVDNHVVVNHMQPNSMSRQNFKGILDNHAKAVFDGKIYVAPGADGTQASQLSKNILLSNTAEVDTKPQLEIYADDVKCNHGATLGKFSEEELFYFVSRGIERKTAIQMLSAGFVRDVILQIQNQEVQKNLLPKIQQALKRLRVLGINTMYNVDNIRKQFPILSRQVNDKPLVYLDNAATTLKPQVVIDAINEYYSYETANVHRGIHFLSAQATEKYEGCRKKVQKFINASSETEVIFTSGTTAGVNLVAWSFAKNKLQKGDKIVITQMEHHSNLVPWQMLAKEKGFKLEFIPLNAQGEWDLNSLDKMIDSNTKLVAFNYVSNSLGTINPVEKMIAKAKSVGAYTVVDAAQAIAHFPIDVQKLDCDFLAFSSHKIFGPTGFGVLYGKLKHLEEMPPIFGGGDMIRTVTLAGSTWNDLPFKFEAGTPHISGGIGLSAAIDFVSEVSFEAIQSLEEDVLNYTHAQLMQIEGIKLFGTSKNKIPIFSFNIEGIHATDLATYLDQQGIAVRTGHHCTMPALEYFGIHGMARASFSIYNTKQEVDKLVEAVDKAKSFFL